MAVWSIVILRLAQNDMGLALTPNESKCQERLNLFNLRPAW